MKLIARVRATSNFRKQIPLTRRIARPLTSNYCFQRKLVAIRDGTPWIGGSIGPSIDRRFSFNTQRSRIFALASANHGFVVAVTYLSA